MCNMNSRNSMCSSNVTITRVSCTKVTKLTRKTIYDDVDTYNTRRLLFVIAVAFHIGFHIMNFIWPI